MVDHASRHCVELLKALRPQIGIIAGARVLPRTVIECFSLGIINFHPGLIPHVRGLDALQWAIHLDQPLGVTAHLIDHRIDAGRIAEQRLIDEFADDTLIDMSLRLEELQVQMVSSTLKIITTCNPADLEVVSEGVYRRSFPAEWSTSLSEAFARRLARLSNAA